MTSRNSPKLKPTLWDALVVAAVIVLGVITALLFYGDKTGSGQLTVVITVAGEEAARTPLSAFTATDYTNGGYTLHVAPNDDHSGVCVQESDCPSQDCVHTGTITRSGESIVCLPAQIVIHLEGSSDGPDLIVG